MWQEIQQIESVFRCVCVVVCPLEVKFLCVVGITMILVLHLPCSLASSAFDITSTFDTDILAELLLFLPMPDNQEVPL